MLIVSMNLGLYPLLNKKISDAYMLIGYANGSTFFKLFHWGALHAQHAHLTFDFLSLMST